MKLFVYGTLQPGEPLAGWLEPAYAGEHHRATTPGRLFHVWGGSDDRPYYPVALVGLQEAQDGPKVHGTVLSVDPLHPALERTIRMEMGAGYEVVQVLCELTDGTFVEAHAFRSFSMEGCEPIFHGDWLQVVHPIHPDVESKCDPSASPEEVSPV